MYYLHILGRENAISWEGSLLFYGSHKVEMNCERGREREKEGERKREGDI
jgi:hypothetical protein